MLFRAIGSCAVLRLRGEQVETLWDTVLPVEVLALWRIWRGWTRSAMTTRCWPFRALWLERWPEALA